MKKKDKSETERQDENVYTYIYSYILKLIYDVNYEHDVCYTCVQRNIIY